MVRNSVTRNTFVAQKEAFVRKETEERKEAEELYETMAMSSPVGVYIAQDGRFCYVNPRFQQISGYSEKELLNMRPLEIVHPEDRQRVRDHAVAMLKGQIDTPCQFRALGRDGEVHWGLETTTSVTYRGRRASLGNFIDITDSVRAEQALMESENKFSKAFLASPAMVSITTLKDGIFIEVNDSFLKFYGYSRDEVIGRSTRELNLWEKAEDRVRMLKILEEHGSVRGEEFNQYDKQRRVHTVVFSAEKISIKNKPCLIVTTIDITDRKKMEQAIRESGEKFENLFEHAKDAIFLADMATGKIIDVNTAGCKMLGLPKEKIIGKKQAELHPPELVEKYMRSFQDYLMKGKAISDGIIVQRDDGRRILVDISASFFKIGEKSILQGIFHDITERKQMEEKLKQNMEELQAANDKLRELDKMKDSFLSTVSHELRTPLTSIKSFAEILLTYDEDKETQKEFLSIINQESDRLTKLINDFLDLSKIEAGRMQWEDKKQPLIPIIENAVHIVQALAKEKNINININRPENLPVVTCDKDRLMQVITNLLSNSIKFTTKGGKITVGVKTVNEKKTDDKPDTVIVSITDSGIGIAPENHAAVFEKFKQVGDTLTDKPKGTGLGLPICKEIIEHYNGKIWVESDLGKGATFAFSLPLTASEKVEEPMPEVEEKPAEGITEDKLILVVDDEDNIRNFLVHELTKKGYHVLEASNGMEALNLTRERHPDLITLDVQMPDISGFDVTAVLKNDDDTKDIPILILSVIEDKFKAYKLGANDCMTKPFNNDELMAKVNQLLIGTKKTVLVVDDDRSLVKSVKYHLEHKGYLALVAYDGEQALEIIENQRPDLIVLDIIMPNKDGYEVIKTLKSNTANASIPIVLMTGIEIDGGRVKALSIGASEYITKSDGFNKLYEAIDNILGSGVIA